jgi:carboxymethylenebutenolidase
MTNLNFGDTAGQDVRGAVQFLKAGGCAKVGVTGFCMGGALTLLAAVNVPEVDAAVVFYGYPPLEYVDAGKIKAPLMGHFALRDVPFPIAGVDALEGKLQAAKVDYEFHRYEAQHAFFNETQVGAKKLLPMIEYEPAAAQLAWQRTLGFFERHLR